MIRGSKGARTPTDATDTLRSTQRAEIVDILGEGIIGGLVNGLKSVYLDGVPVENADGSRNFQEFNHWVSLGGPTTTAPPHTFGNVQTEVGVGVNVTAAIPVVRTIADANVDQVRVTIQVPGLVEQKDNGDRVGSSFEWAIDVQSNGGGYVERYRGTVSGKASSAYSRAVLVDLKAAGPAPWQVRVRRITADSASASIVNAFGWASYTAISGVRMLYRNSAALGLSFDAQNFSAVPTRAYDVVGTSDWQIPVNYNPLDRSYFGVWNGTFKLGFTNNPAWVLYGLITNPRYGLGEYISVLPDKWTLYRLAQWCDGLVPDGRGGTEPRYTINTVLMQQGEAVRLLQDICAIFRGSIVYTAGTLGAFWDAPADPVAIYTPANVVGGLFNYTDGSRAGKKSVFTCWYNDLSQMGKPMPATHEEPILIEKYGVRSDEIRPIGVTSPGQAIRMAKWALWTTEVEDQLVAFRVGQQGQAGRIGEVFQVTDPSETGERLGGRVASATTTQVVLDSTVELMAGETYTLWVTLPDPADPTRLIAQERTVTTPPGIHGTLTVATAYSQAPMAQTMWLLDGSNVAPTLWRYIGMQEVQGEDGSIEFEIVGVRHIPGKWAFIENNQPLTVRPTRRLGDAAAKVTDLAIAETVYIDGTTLRIRATVTWLEPAAGLRYLVAWRLDNGPWSALSPTGGNTVDIDGLQPGLLEVRVQSQNALGNLSPAVEAWLPLTGEGSAPPNVTGLAVSVVGAGIRIDWARWESSIAGETEIRFGPDWDAAAMLFRGKANTYTSVAPPPGTYVLWFKHFDATGLRESPTASTITVVWDGTNLLQYLKVTADAQIFKVATGGAATPSSVTITAQGTNLGGAPSFAVVSGVATLTGTGVSRSLSYASMLSEMVTVEVTWDSQVDRVSIFKLRDGSGSYSWGLVNEHQGITCDVAGTPTAGQLPITSQLVVAYEAAILSSGVAFTVGAVSGFTGVSIHPTTGIITITGITADTASAEFIATIGAVVLRRVLTANKIRNGASGKSLYVAQFYRQQAGAPATPASGSGSYNFATGVLTPPAGWSIAAPTVSTTPTWLTETRFETADPTATVAGGTYTAPIIDAQKGTDGVSVLTLEIFSLGLSATPTSTTASYNFSTDTFSPGNLTAGWSRDMPAAVGTTPVYRSAFTFSTTTPTVPVVAGAWKAPVVVAQNGTPGTPGTSGTSARVAYALINGNPVISGVAVQTFGPSSLPATNSWSPSTATAWTPGMQTPGAGQSLIMTQGLYDPATNQTTWQPPFLANFKVGSLSALSADLGVVTAGSINTTGYVRAEGNTSLAIPDPGSQAPSIPRTVSSAFNTSLASQIGSVAYSGSVFPAYYGYNSGTGPAMVAAGNNLGLSAYAFGGTGVAVRAVSPYISVLATHAGVLTVTGARTLKSEGVSEFNGQVISTVGTASAAMKFTPVASLPPPTLGGVHVHSAYGLIVSDGTNWYRPNVALVPV